VRAQQGVRRIGIVMNLAADDPEVGRQEAALGERAKRLEGLSQYLARLAFDRERDREGMTVEGEPRREGGITATAAARRPGGTCPEE
jgi:hypothetical protein